MAATASVRPIKSVVKGSKMMEGAGVRICRTVGTSGLRNLDPFLMLDELKVGCWLAVRCAPGHGTRCLLLDAVASSGFRGSICMRVRLCTWVALVFLAAPP